MFAAALVAALAISCGGGGDTDREIAELREQVTELQERVSAAEASASAAPEVAVTASPAPTVTQSPSPQPDPTSVPVSPPQVRFIANTGGVGVSVRTGCRSEDRADGSWPEAAEVLVREAGIGPCEAWSIATFAGVTSWVSNQYLSVNKPAPPPPPSVGTPSPAPAQSSLPVPTGVYTYRPSVSDLLRGGAPLGYASEFSIEAERFGVAWSGSPDCTAVDLMLDETVFSARSVSPCPRTAALPTLERLGLGTHTLRLRFVDAAGSRGPWSEPVTFQVLP